MVQVRIGGIALDASGQHVLLLKPLEIVEDEGTVLPIWIGELEATSILIAVEGAEAPRPLAHDLMVSLLAAANSTVDQVEITRLEAGTYFAEVTIGTPYGSRVVDSRPSDAVALASRTQAPLFVADDVWAEAGVHDITADAEEARKLDEFKRFLDDIEPEDFEA